MCDYCGCRHEPAIAELSQEHEQVLELSSRMRWHARERDLGAAQRTLAALQPLLAVHTHKEEQGPFAQLRRAWGADDRIDALIREHHDIDELLRHVEDGRAGSTRPIVRRRRSRRTSWRRRPTSSPTPRTSCPPPSGRPSKRPTSARSAPPTAAGQT